MLERLIDRYKDILREHGDVSLERFCSRLEDDPEAARAEAIMFLALRARLGNGQVTEDPKQGGIDFSFHARNGDIAVEVSCLKASAVAAESGVPNDLSDRSGSFKPIGRNLYGKVISKVRQSQKTLLPLLLAITTEHYLGSILMDEHAARQLLTGKEYITFAPNDTSGPVSTMTRLEDSVFYSFDSDESIGRYRRDISAVLLVHIAGGGYRAVGALNPEPTRPFNPSILPWLPFCKSTMNELSGRIDVEWNRPVDKAYISFESLAGA